MSFHGTQCKVAVDVDNGVAFTDALATDKVQSVSINFEGNLVDVYTLGERDPQEIKEGTIAISGTIEQLYASRDLIGKFLGESDFYKRLADFSFYLYPNGETGGQPYIKLSNVKFGGGSISVDVGGIMAANVTWSGLAIEVGTV